MKRLRQEIRYCKKKIHVRDRYFIYEDIGKEIKTDSDCGGTRNYIHASLQHFVGQLVETRRYIRLRVTKTRRTKFERRCVKLFTVMLVRRFGCVYV